MAKEWILNSATNRWQLNFSRNVGKVSEEIRYCSPKSKEDWENYYFENVRPKDHLIELGKRLYVKVTEVVHSELSEITEQDCIDYLFQLVIDRTYDGYRTEIETVYGQLQDILNIQIKPAPDEWDRSYNVDFFIHINKNYIGLQIKPVRDGAQSQIPQIFKEVRQQEITHNEFTATYGGKVFYVYSTKENGKKVIQNIEVIEEIRNEMERLRNLI